MIETGCVTCKYWREHRRTYHGSRRGECGRIALTAYEGDTDTGIANDPADEFAAAGCLIAARFVSRGDFGCVLHEPREVKA